MNTGVEGGESACKLARRWGVQVKVCLLYIYRMCVCVYVIYIISYVMHVAYIPLLRHALLASLSRGVCVCVCACVDCQNCCRIYDNKVFMKYNYEVCELQKKKCDVTRSDRISEVGRVINERTNI